MNTNLDATGSDSSVQPNWLFDPSFSLDSAATTGVNKDFWVLEIYDRINHLSSQRPASTNPSEPSPEVIDEIIKLLQLERPPSAGADGVVTPPVPAALPPYSNLSLHSDLAHHPSRLRSVLCRSLGSLTWGRVIAEMSYLVCKHVKRQGMGLAVPDGVFADIRESAMMRVGRSPFRIESVTSDQLTQVGSGFKFRESFDLEWESTIFSKYVRLHLGEVARAVRESNCETARFFVLGDSNHPGIVPPGMTDDEKKDLLSQMVFSSDNGCTLLHQIKDGHVTSWFGNHEFASIVQKSLYDISCPGWCGVLGETQDPVTGVFTVCQPTEVYAYTAALQIAWLVHVARFYLETDLKQITTFRPTKRMAAGNSQSQASAWLTWTETLNNAVLSDMRTVCKFLGDVIASKARGSQAEEGFDILQSYLQFISRPANIPHLGSLGSFLYADPPPLVIDDILNMEMTA